MYYLTVGIDQYRIGYSQSMSKPSPFLGTGSSCCSVHSVVFSVFVWCHVSPCFGLFLLQHTASWNSKLHTHRGYRQYRKISIKRYILVFTYCTSHELWVIEVIKTKTNKHVPVVLQVSCTGKLKATTLTLDCNKALTLETPYIKYQINICKLDHYTHFFVT